MSIINYGWTIAEQSTDSTDNGVRSIRFEVLVRACRGLENLKVLWSSKSLSAVQGTLWQCNRSTGYFLFRLSTDGFVQSHCHSYNGSYQRTVTSSLRPSLVLGESENPQSDDEAKSKSRQQEA